jgi:hypothetical protein
MHNFNRGKKWPKNVAKNVAKNVGYFFHLQKSAQNAYTNNRPMGENKPNLVTLAGLLHTYVHMHQLDPIFCRRVA